MTKLQQLRKELKAKNERLGKVFKEAGVDMDFDKVVCLDGCKTTQDKTAKVRELNNELSDLGKQIDELVALEKSAKETADREKMFDTPVKSAVHPVAVEAAANDRGYTVQSKTLGQMVVESKAYETRKTSHETSLIGAGMNVKTLFQTSAGWSPETTRTGRLVMDAQRPIQVVDIIPIGSTNQNAVVYMEETTFTNNAAEASEGGAFGEAALALTEQTSNVRKIAVFIPVTDEQLEDEARVASYIDNRLRFMINQRLDLQILVGDGAAPNLDGINNVSGIQTQAKGADSVPDAIRKAITLVNVTGQAQASAVVIHPNDWQAIRLLTTADGIYLWGSPSETGQSRIWGLPVIEAQAQTENTALVGDYANFIELVMRSGLEVKISDSHDDYFVKGKQAIRATLRAALPVYRPAAFCTVTGI